VPPLRARREDLPALVAYFLHQNSEKQGKKVEEISQKALALLEQYPWPGNVRELENEIARAVALTPDGQLIPVENLSEKIVQQKSLRVALPTEASSLRQARRAFDQEYVADMLRRNQGNAVKAAKELGISRQMLQKLIKEYGLREKL
jgi:two-component system response regulator HupR/HoxA